MGGASGTLPPALVRAGNSYTVSYKDRLLYSKYDPQKAALGLAASLAVRKNTLVLCFSPVLCYGVAELAARLPESCALLLVETDALLFDFTVEHCPASVRHDPAVFLLPRAETGEGVKFLEEKNARDFWQKPFPRPGAFRRVVRADFSAGTAFAPAFYDALEKFFAEALSQFWKNRATLMHLGRLYCRNLFLNLASLPRAGLLAENSVSRPILVAGSGPSLDRLFSLDERLLKAFYIIAVDTALGAFAARGITPNLVVQVEAQFAIEAAYTGAPANIRVAADLVSRRRNAEFYFFSAFSAAAFIARLRKRGLLPPEIPAMGSVALSAVYLALRLRRGDAPVFVSGADFSFLPGKTHCRASPSHRLFLAASSRLSGSGDFFPAFRPGAFFAYAKNGAAVVTDPALSGYRALFAARFASAPALYDASESGLFLGLPAASMETLARCAEAALETGASPEEPTGNGAPVSARAAAAFLREEEDALLSLRSLLRGEGPLGPQARKERVLALLDEREYLYLHFPDGCCVSASPSFLNRVSVEIGFFLKYIRLAMATG